MRTASNCCPAELDDDLIAAAIHTCQAPDHQPSQQTPCTAAASTPEHQASAFAAAAALPFPSPSCSPARVPAQHLDGTGRAAPDYSGDLIRASTSQGKQRAATAAKPPVQRGRTARCSCISTALVLSTATSLVCARSHSVAATPAVGAPCRSQTGSCMGVSHSTGSGCGGPGCKQGSLQKGRSTQELLFAARADAAQAHAQLQCLHEALTKVGDAGRTHGCMVVSDDRCKSTAESQILVVSDRSLKH